jgi:hypothetical protein
MIPGNVRLLESIAGFSTMLAHNIFLIYGHWATATWVRDFADTERRGVRPTLANQVAINPA